MVIDQTNPQNYGHCYVNSSKLMEEDCSIVYAVETMLNIAYTMGIILESSYTMGSYNEEPILQG
jgi:hypothetical protein